MSSTESDQEDDILSEIENMNNVILLLKENIDALNTKFKNYEANDLPQIYLEEFSELTNKLHELDQQKQILSERLHERQQEKRTKTKKTRTKDAALQQDEQENEVVTTEPESTSNSSTLNRKPKVFLRAYLPNEQRTSVQVVPGLPLRDALGKAMSRRDLKCEMCVVTEEDSDVPIPWDTDISLLQCKEVRVKIMDVFPTYIYHQFIRKTFFSLAFCECCRRLLFTGFYCNNCNYRFHQRCADKVPPQCNKLHVDTFYQRLLANPESQAGIIHPGLAGYYGGRHPRSLNSQDRSNSAPNVCINNVLKPLSASEQRTLQNARPLQVLLVSISIIVFPYFFKINKKLNFRHNQIKSILIPHKPRPQIPSNT